MEKLPPEKVQQLLNSFAQLQLQPKILAGVYHVLTEAWPLPAAESGLDYEAQKLFNAGINTFHKIEKFDNEAADVLESLDSLLHRARLSQTDNQDQLIACAYELWPYAPDASKKLCRRYPDAKRMPEQLKELVGTIAEGDDGDADRFPAALVHESDCANATAVQAATMSLLAQPPQEANGSPDPVLALWAKAVAEQDPQPLLDTFVRKDTNDEQAVRLYYRILENIEYISDEQFITLLRKTLSVPEGREKTADSLVRSLKELTAAKFSTDDQSKALCEGVLSVFSDIPKRARKAELAKTCTPLGLKNVVTDAGYTDRLSDDDMQVIEKYTGKIRL
ncbi:hypothetical protein KG088_17660 [Halomonas sp. TRM85114]|uniref:hypothetical protein n=1 Tax=Halomonas jincaotanensis TaxID=2810616 RepID=UPI001BD414DE|nr:hypothetical protein [Halomonas jincaotanensis]MBS9405437.1 hypothetical protein [Halomonas jincaotanensis]